MVACIAVEAISILEKLHAKGYLSFQIYLSTGSCNLFILFVCFGILIPGLFMEMLNQRIFYLANLGPLMRKSFF
jgi:hypothetical protein